MTRGLCLALLVVCSVIGAYAHSPMPLLGLVNRSRHFCSHRVISHRQVCLTYIYVLSISDHITDTHALHGTRTPDP
jgi:hypothetical protein